MEQTKLKALTDYLRKVPAGPVKDAETRGQIVSLLAAVWEEIPGATAEATYTYKLDRMEAVEWNGESLSFTLERHGRTVQGSKRASLQSWKVSFDPPEAVNGSAGFRNVEPNAPNWYPDEAVDELAEAIEKNNEHPNLKRLDANTLKIVGVGDLVPGDNKQTLAGRKKRFRSALNGRLAKSAWREIGIYKYTNTESQSD